LKLAETVQTKDCAASPQSITTDPTEPISPRETSQFTISGVFRLLQEVTLGLTRFWEIERVNQGGGRMLETLLPRLNEGSPLIQAAYWLVLRLGRCFLNEVFIFVADIEIVLSCALMAKEPIRLPLYLLAPSHSQSVTRDMALQSSQKAIMLCAEAVMFSQEYDNWWLQERYGPNRAGIWNALIHEFSFWFKKRPEGYQPIIELYPKDGIQTDNDFPSIAFTSGAALLANQLYHTGMLLLLQKKPRFSTSSSSSSNSMSRLWHVHRICGIAIQNDAAATWDPCLIASLIIAARTLTHESQQTAIVHTLENTQKLTGWNVSQHIANLESEWRLAHGW
jgi:hypothetical protein